MSKKADYRESHSAEGYGKSYDATFKDNPYRKYIWNKEKNLINTIIDRLFPNRVDQYLDFACGTGRIIGHIEPKTKNATGVDISASMLEVAERNTNNAKLIQADLTSDNVLSDHKYDLISSFRFFLNAQSELRYEVMEQLSSMLAEDGYLMFNIHNNTTGITNRITTAYARLRGKTKGWNEMSIREVKVMLDKFGLEVVEMHNYATYPIFHEENKFPKAIVQTVDGLFSKVIKMPSLSTYILYICKAKRK